MKLYLIWNLEKDTPVEILKKEFIPFRCILYFETEEQASFYYEDFLKSDSNYEIRHAEMVVIK
jgi:hypothetical protein